MAEVLEKEKTGPQPADFDWYPDCTGQTVVVVASGPSANKNNFELLRNRPDAYVIAINESWKLVPFAQMLYGCDAAWWYRRRSHWPAFGGLKVTQDHNLKAMLPDADIKRVWAVRGVEVLHTGQRGYIGWGGNSGFQALNLAVHFNPAKIILCGYDMTIQNGLHWHGEHGHGLHNPKAPYVARWRRVTDRAVFTLERMGIVGVSTALEGAMPSWPKMTLEEALAHG